VKPWDSFVGWLVTAAIVVAVVLVSRPWDPWDKAEEPDPEQDSWAKRALTRIRAALAALRSEIRDTVRAWTAQRPPRKPPLPKIGGVDNVVSPDPAT
jgi:hypothetical protein